MGAIEKFVGATPEEVIDGIRLRSGQFLLEAWNTMFQGLFTRVVVDAGLLEGVLPVYYDFFTDRIVPSSNSTLPTSVIVFPSCNNYIQ